MYEYLFLLLIITKIKENYSHYFYANIILHVFIFIFNIMYDVYLVYT